MKSSGFERALEALSVAWNFLYFFPLVANPLWKFLCLVICSQTCTSGFFTCSDVAVDHNINVLTKNSEMDLFKVMGFPTQIFSCTDKLIGEGGMNCSLNESCFCSCAEMLVV